eukprot:TRINITY_DN4665_c0_g1_i1.p1 TRINITY_DN4665_c0_g1~~TRINITY_DN4665_c0_g1_i1.p1  ORF type:complete len:258 (-),score=114.26 TRINITY_DN4665_c0_g1_i1:100-873(-)
MANTLSGPNIEEEYLWSVTLDSSNKEYSWDPSDPADQDKEDEEDEDPSCKPNHRLLVKTALLHPEAKSDEVTILQIETKGYKDEKVKTPFVMMKGGGKVQQYLDLLVPDSASIKIVGGTGPITLVGSHCVDFYDYRNFGGDDTLEEDEDDGAESSEDDEMDMEEQETVNMKEDKEEDKAKKSEKSGEEGKKTPKKQTPKKDTPKKDSAKKETPKKSEKESEGKSPKEGAAKKTPESKKRKSSEEAVAEKKRKKSDDK